MDQKNDFVFFGTDLFAVKVLETLKKRDLVPALLVTTPDEPVGRKQVITPPPTKVWAEQNNIAVIQPASLKDPLPALAADHYPLFIVASYGKIIPQTILDLPEHGALNIHPSLLPKYRGPAPLEQTILNGDRQTGVTIMKIDAELDHGPVVLAVEMEKLDAAITYPELRDRLAELGASILADVMPAYLAGTITPTPQDHTIATYTKLIKKEDGLIDPDHDPETAWRKYRAFSDWPGVYFFKDNKRIVVKKARFEDGRFIIERVVPEGRTETSWPL